MKSIQWDCVIITASDMYQEKIHLQQVANKASLQGTQCQIVVIGDRDGSEGNPIGTAGSTIHCLKTLVNKSENGVDFLKKKILLIHAGGFSKRLPCHSVFGKLFAPVPVALEHDIDLVDEKIRSTSRFCPYMVNGGAFVTSSDHLETFSLEGINPRDFIGFEGVVALAHPSSLDIGTKHGVYVLQPVEESRGCAWVADNCKEVLQKPTIEVMADRGAVIKGTSKVYTDSSFWITPDVAGKLLKFSDSPDLWKNESCIYGDFLACFGTAESKFRETFLESGPETSLKRLQKDLYQTFRRTPLKVLVLEDSNFYHFGTVREYIENLTSNPELQKHYRFQNLTELSNVTTTAVSHCDLDTSCKFTNCVLEYAVIRGPVKAEDVILSNVQVNVESEVTIPPGWMLHTVTVKRRDNITQRCDEVTERYSDGGERVTVWQKGYFVKGCEDIGERHTADIKKVGRSCDKQSEHYEDLIKCSKNVGFVTLALHCDSDPKGKSEDLELPFGNLKIALKDFGISENVGLWSAPIFKIYDTMSDSFLATLQLIKHPQGGDGTGRISMAEATKLENVEVAVMMDFRKSLKNRT